MTPRKRMWRRIGAMAGALALLLIVVGDGLVKHKPHFEGTDYLFDTAVGFYPGLGFFGTVVLVLLARAFGVLLSRRENYYHGR